MALQLTVGVKALVLGAPSRHHFVIALVEELVELRTEDDFNVLDLLLVLRASAMLLLVLFIIG